MFQFRTENSPRRTTSLTLELLEDRTSPSVVTSTSDDGSDPATLRYQLHQGLDELITFDQSLAGETIRLDPANGSLMVNRNVTVASSVEITISGGNAGFSVFRVSAAVSTALEGLTISDGYVPSGLGGGIFNQGDLTVTNSTISRNSAWLGSGGGIYNAGALYVFNTYMSENSARHGGGIYNAGAVLVVTDSTIDGNTSVGRGAGVDNQGTANSSQLIERTIISNNTGGFGVYNQSPSTDTLMIVSSHIFQNQGGVQNNAGSVIIDATTIALNALTGSGTLGGGIGNFGSSMLINNSTISGNSAAVGGGIYSLGNNTAIVSSTITQNSAVGSGSNGVGGGVFAAREVSVWNTIIAGNTATNYAQDVRLAVISLGYNLIGTTTWSTGWIDSDLTGTDNDPLDARLAGLAFNGGFGPTHAMLADSPALQAGDESLGGTFDQDGNIRPTPPSIGATEVVEGMAPHAPSGDQERDRAFAVAELFGDWHKQQPN